MPLTLACVLLASGPLSAAKKPAPPPAVTGEVAEMLQFMREEEKLARDVYLFLNGLYATQTRTFANIALSEQQHTDAVRNLLLKYGVEDPAADTAEGEFVNEKLQALYDALVESGSAGLIEGLIVGVTIETKDITDIVEAIELSAAYPDIVIVYSNLLAGSRNHLAAFEKALDVAED
jgi:hypothetical protein